MSRTRLRTLAGFAALATVLTVWAAPGCKKEKESLIQVEMEAIDANSTMLTDVTITVTTAAGDQVKSAIFDLPATGLPTTPDSITFGVYIPGGVTGMLSVTAIARPTMPCNGYLGTKTVRVAGGDSPTVKIIMRPGNTCNTGGGGGGGTTGAGGAGGGSFAGAGGSSTSVCGTTTGTPPAPVMPPTLASCTDLSHIGGLTCDAVNNTNNPYITDLTVSPDGQLMVSSAWSYVTDDVSLRIWKFDPAGGPPVQCGPEYTASAAGPTYVAFSPNGKYLAVAMRYGWVEIFAVPSLDMVSEIKSAPGTIYGVGFSPDSQTVFTLDYDNSLGDGNLYADRVDGTAITSRLVGVDPDALAISRVASGGNVTLAVAGYIGNVGVYSFNGTAFSTTAILTTTSSASAYGIAFSADGQLLAAGTDDGSVRFWAAPFTTDATSGKNIVLGSNYVPDGIAFSPYGTYVAITFGPEVDIWNTTTRAFVSRHNTVAVPGVSSPPYARSVAFSASGGALITGEDLCGKIAYCAN